MWRRYQVSATRIFVQFGRGVLDKNLPKCEFRENSLSESHILLKGVINFKPYFPYLAAAIAQSV